MTKKRFPFSYYGSRINPEILAARDLRPGLPLQSIHDGEKFVHEPRRLTVVIESETGRIDTVLAEHPGVRQLFGHEWIHLVCLTGDRAEIRRGGIWHRIG